MKFHYHLLINQTAGGGNGAVISEKICAILDKHAYAYTTYFTNYPNHEQEIVAELAQTILQPWKAEDSPTPFPLLIVMGGDGTLHQVINQLKLMNIQLPIGYIPAGSGNDFARGINLPLTAEKAFWQIFKAKEPRMIHVLRYEEKVQEEHGLAVNNVGIGIDAAIVHQVNHSPLKKQLNHFNLGSFSYISTIFSVLFKQKGFPILVEANGQTYSYKKAFLCTTTIHPFFGGGVAIAPSADITQDVFQFVLVERIPMYKIFWLILLLTRKKHESSRYFHQITTNKLRIISTTSQYAQADGEDIGSGPYDLCFSLDQQQFWL